MTKHHTERDDTDSSGRRRRPHESRPSWGAKQRKLLLRQYAVTVVVALVGAMLSLLVAFLSYSHNHGRAQAALDVVTRDTAAAIQSDIDVHLEVVASVAALFRVSGAVTRDDFRAFSSEAIRRHRGIQALEWAPRVLHSERAAFVKSVRDEGFPGFRLTERGPDGQLKLADERDVYYPVVYIEPFGGNERAFGYADMGRARRGAIKRARDAGRAVGSDRLALIQEEGGQFGVLVFAPVYADLDRIASTVERRREGLTGFVEGVFRVDDLIRDGIRPLDLRMVNFAVFDQADSADPRPLYIHRLSTGESSPTELGVEEGRALRRRFEGGMNQVSTVTFAGRQWQIVMIPAEGFVDTYGSVSPLIVLFVGLLFTLLLTSYVGTYQQRASKIEALVEQRTAEMKAANERLQIARIVIDKSVVAVVRLDASGTIVGVNEAACELYGYSRREMLALTIGQLDPRKRAVRWDAHWASLKKGKASTFEASHQVKGGGSIPVEVTSNFLKYGERSFVCWFVRDVSDRLKTEAALRRSEEQLQQSQKMEAIGLLAGGVAHDFNNLLSGILGFAEIGLMKLEADHPVRRNFSEITKAGNRAASLTRQLLAFSRRQVLKPEQLSLNDIVADMGKMLERLIGENIELEIKLGEQLRPVFADPGQIEQVILNLCVNARDAMPDGGELSIETARVIVTEDDAEAEDSTKVRRLDLLSTEERLEPGDYLRLSVQDSGVGMDDEVRAHIFEPFFTTKGVGEGTGLGLATVFGIVTQSGGAVAVESEPGQGTRFDVYLPSVDSSQVPSMYPDGEELCMVTPTKNRHVILLVEDEETVRELCDDILQSHGYEVVQARSGEEALEILARCREEIDLLITDVVMTGMSGIQLAEAVHERMSAVPVIVMTGYTDRQVELQSLPEGRLLFKPFSPTDLINEVKDALAQRFERRGRESGGSGMSAPPG